MRELVDVYTGHMERLIQTMPHSEQIVRNVLLDRDVVEKTCMILAMKTEQTRTDGMYHNAITGFPFHFNIPSFCVIEIGCCQSISAFSAYWTEHKFDSYQDYVEGILYTEGKGFDLYERLTGETLPETPTQEILGRFLVGHILRCMEEKMLFVSLVRVPLPPDEQIMVFPPELL